MLSANNKRKCMGIVWLITFNVVLYILNILLLNDLNTSHQKKGDDLKELNNSRKLLVYNSL